MKLLIRISWKVLISLALVACNQPESKEVGKGYFEGLGILNNPVEFAKELSLPHNTWKGSLSGDGRKFHFFRKKNENEEDYRIYESDYNNGNWGEPKEIEFSDGNSDLYPSIRNDGKSMLFVSYRKVAGDSSVRQNSNFWMSSYEKKKWTTPVFLDNLSFTSNYESQPSITSNGNLYYSTDGEYNGNWESIKMVAKKVENGYAKPEELESINQWNKEMKDYSIYEICMSPDEDFLIVTISKKDENADLYISRKKDDKWTKPIPLGNGINTMETENFPYISSNGKYLFFTRGFSKFYHISISEILDWAD